MFRKIIEAGLTVSTDYDADLNGPGFTFVVNELLNPPSKEAEELFAQFKSELNHFENLGAVISTRFLMSDKDLTVTYFIPVPTFSVIMADVDILLKYLSDKDSKNDFDKMNVELNLETYRNNIEDEIKFYCKNYF